MPAAAAAAMTQVDAAAAAWGSWVQAAVDTQAGGSVTEIAGSLRSAVAGGSGAVAQAGAELGRALQEQAQSAQQAVFAVGDTVGRAGFSTGGAVDALSGSATSLSSALAGSSSLSRLEEAGSAVLQSSGHLTSSLRDTVDAALAIASADPSFLSSAPARLAGLVASSLSSSASSAVASATSQPGVVPAAAAVAAGLTALLVKAVAEAVKDARAKGSELPTRYDPEAIAAYFKLRPARVAARAAWVAGQCSELIVALALDTLRDERKEREGERARQLVELITRLGPTAIKIGQALSIRPDIVPPAFIRELQSLQDRVPSFPSEDARRIISEELGRPAEEVFEGLETPVAAASLGQVYQARIRSSNDLVAVKVQRPSVRADICCDLLLLRALSSLLSLLPSVHTDVAELLDSFASRFFEELDYEQEGRNAERFAKDMAGLRGVVVPRVYGELTSTRVLTTAWISGEKLSESQSGDVSSLVTLALNCYLIQLLETGFLHADPHPGNLLRTTDGRLCILDFGFMTEVTPPQRVGLVSYIAHLLSGDYERVAEDLVTLGFVPAGMVDPEKTAAVVPQLASVMGQITQGGGARNINFGQVAGDLSAMARDYVFVLPPYFALILRAFGTLEGIGLDRDPGYSTLQECYPYIAKRLLTDDSPRSRAVLRDFLYGSGDRLDVARVEELAQNFLSFRQLMSTTTSSSVAAMDAAAMDAVAAAAASRDGRFTAPAAAAGVAGVAAAVTSYGMEGDGAVDPVAREVLLTVLASEGSYLQELMLTELTRTVDALSREALAALWSSLSSSSAGLLPIPSDLQQPGTYPLPLLLPGAVAGALQGSWRTASLSGDDVEALGTVRRLWALLGPQMGGGEAVGGASSPGEALAFLQSSAPLLASLLPGAATTVLRFVVMLVHRQALRLADDLDGGDSVMQWEADPYSLARSVKPIMGRAGGRGDGGSSGSISSSQDVVAGSF